MGTLLVLAVVLAAEPQVESPEFVPTTAVYLQPVTMGVVAVFGQAFSLSVGAQHELSDHWSLSFDLAGVYRDGRTFSPALERFLGTLSVSGSIGPTWRLAGTRLRGLFLSPKLYVIASSNSQSPVRVNETWFTTETGIGTDIAFHWAFGRFFLGAAIGAGLGWVWGADVGVPGPLSTFGGAAMGESLGRRRSGLALSLTGDLIRVGVVF